MVGQNRIIDTGHAAKADHALNFTKTRWARPTTAAF
jgi:hypothetical protein